MTNLAPRTFSDRSSRRWATCLRSGKRHVSTRMVYQLKIARSVTGFRTSEETRPLKERVHGILDEPPSLFVDPNGAPQDPAKVDTISLRFDNDMPPRAPYPVAYSVMLWKPTAVCVKGGYVVAYLDESDEMLQTFPHISHIKPSQLVEMLSKIFSYDP
ncbi:hypothetical protein BDP55DRAFT_625128 [Colletotrichum godetiae]|uniref:Uncharacterized protein n=1 Tax=Colletotrichum godetiae TaxID=1209918 RepID=A0AAJ0F062_9PEZI|nr:uncharacterized protein BDP55DRAFT_625128 [Colletotrichum godetiae]KAK1700860.1 hypothetical protein BDP55DRAFT_625128 [Colletotrichum godetiae]